MKTLRRAENVLSSTEQSRLEQHTALYAIVWDLAAKTSENNPLERERISKTHGKIQTIEESKWDKRKTVGKGQVFFFFSPCLTRLWWLVVNEFLMMFFNKLVLFTGADAMPAASWVACWGKQRREVGNSANPEMLVS